MTVTGGVTFDEMIVHYRIQAVGLLSGGADVLLLETTQDTRNLKAGLIGHRAGVRGGRVARAGHGLGDDRADGHDARGTGRRRSLRVGDARAASLGRLNCATGPEFMTGSHPEPLGDREDADLLLSERGAPGFRRALRRDAGVELRAISRASCRRAGSTSSAAAAARPPRTSGRSPRRPREEAAAACRSTTRPSCRGSRSWRWTSTTGRCSSGERTNVLGSRKFKRLVAEGEFETAAEIARAQVKTGAQVIDVCLQDPDRDEVADAERLPRAGHEDGQGRL